MKRLAAGELLWGVILGTEAYSQKEPACLGYRRRSPNNETLFGEPGRFDVVVSYGIYHCVNVDTGLDDWANPAGKALWLGPSLRSPAGLWPAIGPKDRMHTTRIVFRGG